MPSFCPASSGVRTSSGMTVPSAEVRPRIMEKPRESPTAWPMVFDRQTGKDELRAVCAKSVGGKNVGGKSVPYHIVLACDHSKELTATNR